MKRLCATIIILALLGVSAAAHNWSRAFEQARGSTAMLFHSSGTCTAFSINEQRRYYLSAYHCLPDDPVKAAADSKGTMSQPSPTGMYLFMEAVPNIRAQGMAVVLRIVKADRNLDLVLLEADTGLPALRRGREPLIGEEIAALGYALSEPSLWLIAGNAAYLKDTAGQRRLVFRGSSEIGGMSGGPVINTRGEVVSMVQQGLVYQRQIVPINYGTSIKQMASFARGFWYAK